MWDAVVPGCESRSFLSLVQECALASGRCFIHLRAAPRPHVCSIASPGADAPNGDQGVSTDVTKTREPSRSWRRTRNSPGTHATEGPDPTTRYST
jgi:hypothetical protein